MSDISEAPEFKKILLSLRIIVSAMFLGSLIFCGITVYIIQVKGAPLRSTLPVPITYIGMAMVAVVLIGRLLFLRLMLAKNLRDIARGSWTPSKRRQGSAADSVEDLAKFVERLGDPARLCQVFRMRKITATALLEGPAFFMLITYQIEQRPEALAIAAVLLAGIALSIPTSTGLSHWIETQLQAIERLRQTDVGNPPAVNW